MLLAGSILLLAVHFLAVDVAMAAPLFCLWLSRRRRLQGDALAGRLEVCLARDSLTALALGIAVGCLELGLIWLADDHDFWRAAGAVAPARYWFSLAELIFFAACMAGYLRLRERPKWAAALAILAALDLMYHFPPLFTMLNLLADRPGLADRRLDSSLYRSLMIDPEVLALTVHVILASVAVTAVWLMRRADGANRQPADADADQRPPAVITGSARAALAATLLQLPVGVGVMLSVPNRLGQALMGDDLLATISLALGILATLGLLHHLAAVAFGDPDRRQIRRSILLMLVTVLLMTATLERIRQLGRPGALKLSVVAAARAR